MSTDTTISGVRKFNLKDKSPSDKMHPSDGKRYSCPWIRDSITIHSDGNVSCGLDDPHGNRSFGNIHRQTIAEIFSNPEYERLRKKLAEGCRCHACGLFEPMEDTGQKKARPVLPTTLIIEPTVLCNLRCPQGACDPNNEPGLLTRNAAMLPKPALDKVVDEIGDSIQQVYFFNYGEPFLHKESESMIAHITERSPKAQIVTSTNGIPLKKYERAEAVVRSGLSFITFTISGMTQQSYERYHVRGKLDDALSGLRNVAEAKRRLGSASPEIVWRYLLFNWNDSDAELSAAVALADELGVRLSLYLTHIPEGASSWRLSPGAPLYDKYKTFLDAAHGYATSEPDEDGLYGLEHIDKLGPVRWTTYRARIRLADTAGYVRLALASLHPNKEQTVNLQLPWGRKDIVMPRGKWLYVNIPVPSDRVSSSYEARLEVKECWHPTELLGSQDLRHLGVLLKEDPGKVGLASKLFRRTRLSQTHKTSSSFDSWLPFEGLRDAHAGRFREFSESS